ncbi:KpsF/GutQ family sugar-phosphate isomerase [Wenzhouxiangella sp. AB-CW3]|uniref:KpsF/GutQ family sugar-phosphate isomerase n=1 Tax=Wenzhouxiangella sp. AB-CW3 TaxID=2771012 RepID=UPI00168B2C27|nr:KpsF/GutQ family sugar-phosphate isomerase [Wenzhouxiangella sp. AB-CW3]QOC21878.1 KpsF/GutQ family sugar-phosphate isomerase [Wenzhouxiangella sp. AB-CW3]
MVDSQRIRHAATEVLETEARAISALTARVNGDFVQACRMILDCPGHLIVTGMGKSGHIGHKLAATLASTGTPAFFVHPAEASHGDLGMIRPDDLVLALSNSGETEELLRLLPGIKRLGVGLIAMTGSPEASLARHADVHLDTSVDREACPLGLAPTASTSAQLALGDALAIALLDARGFTAEDFARSHPAGALGRRLLLRISDIMHSGDELPTIDSQSTITEAIVQMTRSRLGLCAVIDNESLTGIVTDGDLRRHLEQAGDIRDHTVASIMTPNPRTIAAGELAAAAVEMMQSHRIQGLLVTNEEGKLVGALNFQDLLQAGVV